MKRNIEIANLVLKFGERNLLDLFSDRFWGPIQKADNIRGRGETLHYFLHSLESGIVEKRAVVHGRLIKILNIEAEQDFDERRKKLVLSEATMRAAPSTYFLIDLASHRIAFLHETRRSPTVSNFEYVIERILLNDWVFRYRALKEQWLEENHRQRFPRGQKGAMEAELELELPRPDFRVTQLPAIKEIDDVLESFETLISIGIVPLRTNDEFPDENERFLVEYDRLGKRLGSSNNRTEIRNGRKGLEKKEAKKFIKAAANGNYRVKLTGKDEAGEPLKSDMEETKVVLRDEVPSGLTGVQKAHLLLKKLIDAGRSGLVAPRNISEQVLARARKVVKDAEEA